MKLLWIALIVGAIAATWYLTTEWKEREFTDRLSHAPVVHDTVRTVKFIPQSPRDSSVHAKQSTMTQADSARIHSSFEAAWNGGKDSSRALVERLSARVSASVVFDSVGTVNVEYDPITRIFTLGLELSLIRSLRTDITNIAQVPVVEHDSWTTRAELVAVGVVAGVIIMAIAH